MAKLCVAYYVEVDEIDPELADLPIDLLHDHRAIHGPVDEVGEARADHVGQIILHLLLAGCRDFVTNKKNKKRQKERKKERKEKEEGNTERKEG